MDPDKYQQAWQAEGAQARVTVDADLLLREVQRNQRDFLAIISRRDVLEVGVALVLLPYWFYAGIAHSLPWTWWLAVPGLLWVAGFIVVDRVRHKQKPSGPGEPLLTSVKAALSDVEHQIWLLRNVFWWYLLPLGAPIAAFFGQSAWQGSDTWWEALAGGGFLFTFLFGLYYFIYCINQSAVRTQLEPRREELRALLAGLGDEKAGDASEERADLASAQRRSRRRTIIAGLCFVAVVLIGVVINICVDQKRDQEPAERSPFAAVRWEGTQPVVKVDGEWFKLVSLNDIPAAEIVVYSQIIYKTKWQKRFEEDLVELLTGMGHPPQDTVKLVVQPLNSSETRTLEAVPMTVANRQAIYAAARARERNE